MKEPIFWNPLSDCAIWLSERTGRPMDARTVLDLVARMGRQGDPTPTIVGIPVPRERGAIRVMMIGHPHWDTPQTQMQQFRIQSIEQQFGPPPCNGIYKYIEQVHPTFAFLCVSHLMRLMIYGRSELAFIDEHKEHAHEQIVLMPWDGGHPITIDACGIKRDDLIALGEALAPTLSSAAKKSSPESEVGVPTAPLMHRLRNRETAILAAEINQAKAYAADPDSATCVWDELTKLAESGSGPMIGFSSDGIQYRGKKYQSTQEPDVFTFKHLRDRMKRAEQRSDARRRE